MPRALARALALALAALAACTDPASDDEVINYIAFGSSATTVTVAWAPIDGATSYTIERGASDDALVPVATVAAEATSFLDTGLAPQTRYSYRLTIDTADGPLAEPVVQAETTDEELLVTGPPTPSGAPITVTVGVGGAAIEATSAGATLVIPPDAVPDGTTITLQPIASPYPDDDAVGVSVGATAPFARPVELVFALDELDAMQPAYVALAVHQDDGSWVAEPRAIDEDAGTATLTIPAATAMPRAGWYSGIPYHEVVKMRSTLVLPARATVKVRETLELTPWGVFSDDPCDGADAAEEIFCGVIAKYGEWAGLIDPQDARRPAKRFRKRLANRVPNYERTWLVNGAIGGSASAGRIDASRAVGGTYTAPPARPPGGTVDVRFTSVKLAPKRRSVPTVPARLAIEDPGSILVTADLDVRGSNAPCPAAAVDVADRVTFAITRDDQGWQVVSIENHATTLGPLIFPTYLTGDWDTEPEAFTATGGTVIEEPNLHQKSVTVTGSWVTGACHYVYDGVPVQVPGQPITAMIAFTIDASDHVVGFTGEWSIQVTPNGS